MRVAFTGSNSTGKTTIVKCLSKVPRLQEYIEVFLYSDARAILQNMGFSKMDTMTQKQMQDFQLTYFHKKKYTEHLHGNFITDRSFVDIAAYWLIRDTWDKAKEEQNLLLNPCKEEAMNYDILFYLPFGRIEFEYDGCRSTDLDFHRKVDSQIKNFLDEWQLKYVIVGTSDLSQRIELVLKELSVLAGVSFN